MNGWRAVLAGCLTLGALAAVGPAHAATPKAPAGSIGHDVSYPQCGGELPTGGSFGIVGINRGKAFSANPCLAAQYDWAEALPHPAMVYLNTGNPAPRSSHYWSRSGAKDPALCRDSTSTTDPGCAYNYGWHAAEHAMAVAKAAGVAGGGTWWLDVETLNSWNGDGFANAADLQGAFDYLRGHGVAEVGIYSTGFQWAQITGSAKAPTGYTGHNAATFRAEWASAFAPKFRMEQAPLWMAGVEGIDVARQRCGQSFTGGRTVLGQYIAGGFDHDLVCGRRADSAGKADASACASGPTVPAGYTAVHGTRGDDRLTGTSAAEIFYGGRGDDRIRGGRGKDILCGGTGRDRLDGGTGDDVVVGGSGRDTLRGAGGEDRLRGGPGDDELSGGGARDTLAGQGGRDDLDGGKARDRCSGGPGRDPKPTRC